MYNILMFKVISSSDLFVQFFSMLIQGYGCQDSNNGQPGFNVHSDEFVSSLFNSYFDFAANKLELKALDHKEKIYCIYLSLDTKNSLPCFGALAWGLCCEPFSETFCDMFGIQNLFENNMIEKITESGFDNPIRENSEYERIINFYKTNRDDVISLHYQLETSLSKRLV